MYFTPSVKEDIKDFYNYCKELKRVQQFIQDPIHKLLVVKGLRRTGKTSLITVALKSTKARFVKIDAREIEPTRKAFIRTLVEKIKLNRSLPKKILSSISKVNVYGVEFSVQALDVLEQVLNEELLIIFVDEVQRLNNSDVDSLLAWIYDSTRAKLILSGSEVGVLEGFLGLNNPQKPLFGRAYLEIEMKRLSEEKAKRFLREGFTQVNKRWRKAYIEEAVEKLDGIIGWLTLYGYYSLSMSHQKALNETMRVGINLVKQEFSNFLTTRRAFPHRYRAILEAVSKGFTAWSEIKRYVSIKLGHSLYDAQFTHLLKTLVAFGFIVEEKGQYLPADPIIKEAFR